MELVFMGTAQKYLLLLIKPGVFCAVRSWTRKTGKYWAYKVVSKLIIYWKNVVSKPVSSDTFELQAKTVCNVVRSIWHIACFSLKISDGIREKVQSLSLIWNDSWFDPDRIGPSAPGKAHFFSQKSLIINWMEKDSFVLTQSTSTIPLNLKNTFSDTITSSALFDICLNKTNKNSISCLWD